MHSAVNSSSHETRGDNDWGDMSDIIARNRLRDLLRSLKSQFPSMAHLDQAVFILALFIYQTPGTGTLADLVYPYLDNVSTKSTEDQRLHINLSIEIQERVLQSVPKGYNSIPSWLNNLSASYQTRFDRFGDPEDIDHALKHAHRAVELSRDGDSSFPVSLNSLGKSHFLLFQCSGMATDLDKAIEFQCRAVALTPDAHANKSTMLHNLASLHLERYERQSKQSDIDEVIACYAEALSLTADAPDALLLEGLGNAYSSRFDQLGKQSDIDQAIYYQSVALSLIADEDEDKPRVLSNLGGSFNRLFTHSGQVSDINTAIQHYTRSISLTDQESPEFPARVNELGTAYERVFEYSGDRKDIDQAIDYCILAMDHSPENHVNKSAWQDSLGALYRSRYKRFGDAQDIKQALHLQQQALALAETYQNAETPNNSLQLILNNLGNAYHTEFERTGHISDIDASIRCLLRALEGLPDEYAHKHTRLNNLGIAYLVRFERLGELGDADKAIECQTRAVELVPPGHRDEIKWIGNLGISYGRRFKRSNDEEDINKAIECHIKVLDLGPEGERFEALNLIGSSYHTRFEYLQQVEDLNRAIDYYNQATTLTPQDHAKWYSPLCNLGKAYLDRFGCAKHPSDLDVSIAYLTQVVSGISDDNADRAIWLTDLGDAHRERFECLKQHDDIVRSIEYLRQAVNSSGYPFVRFRAAYIWVNAASHECHGEMEALTHLMSLLPQVIWLGVPISRRYQDISSLLQEILPHAVAVAIDNNDLNRATEWFEEGRSIVWKQMLQLRTPLGKLRAADAKLAEAVERVAKELDCAASLSGEEAGKEGEASSQRHRRLAQEWTELLEQVRGVPGFEDFLRPQKISSLLRAADSRTVVMVNIMARCDALIIRQGSTSVQRVHLSTFSYEKAVDVQKILVRSLDRAGVRQRNTNERGLLIRPAGNGGHFYSALATLWEHVVRPVLDYLGYLDRTAGSELPHIAWCTTGPLAFLPIHAAGVYGGSNTAKVFDYVVSSYIPTLGALIPLSQSHDTPNFTGVLAVGQADAQGTQPLPGTITELAAIKRQTQCHGLPLVQLDGSTATSTAILSAMDSSTWVHLACHATQSTSNPSASAFQLHDGPLDLSTMTKRSLRNKGLAFLSACQTATGDEALPDEAVHLAAGMLAVGYMSVIATMWSIQDQDAPKVAEWVYEVLFEGGRPDCGRSARALRDAVSRLRNELGEAAFLRWVPYIHIGI